MKKTLIALAVLAASGASFAQVTITGTLAMGYGQTTSVGTNAISIPGLGLAAVATSGADASGFGADTSEIGFAATEDLGGGQKIEATLALAGADRSGESNSTTPGALTGRDATLTYTNNSFGRVQMGATRDSAIHSGIPSADAPVINMDGKLFQLRSDSDFISYAAPVGPVVFLYKLSEASKGLGLGKGTSGASGVTVGQRTSDFVVVYSKGPLDLVGAYRAYDNRNSTTIATLEGLTKDNVFAVQVGYNFGVAKVGFGVNNTTASVGPKVTDMLLGVSVPMGALTLGMTLGRATTSGVSDAAATAFPGGAAAPLFKTAMQLADGTANSLSVGAKYDLSKRTNLTVKYATWTRSGYEQFEAWGAAVAAGGSAVANLNQFGYSANANETSILLSHSF
ncbi:MAG: porin [Rhodoferax sp.]|nr:porin [Rhodoferax sp.]MDP3653067.1 porin [Rhodoferax sp.]